MKHNWIQTYTGKRFQPLDPYIPDICIEDIAHALSMQCRFSGHCTKFYSVAEHCCRVADRLPMPMRLAGLLHDAAEAYLSDVPTPIKQHMKTYQKAEDALLESIFRWAAPQSSYSLHWPLAKEVIVADKRMLETEKNHIMPASPAWSTGFDPYPDVERLLPWRQDEAEEYYLCMFRRLTTEGGI